jgi:hypothetical protein
MTVKVFEATKTALDERSEDVTNEVTNGERMERHGLTRDDFVEAVTLVEGAVWENGLDPWDVFSLGVIAGLNATKE